MEFTGTDGTILIMIYRNLGRIFRRQKFFFTSVTVRCHEEISSANALFGIY